MDRRIKQIFFPNGKCKWPTYTCKGVEHHWLSGKCKSKPQWDIISHLSEWLSSEKAQITNIGKHVVNKESLYIVDRNVNWYAASVGNSMEVSQKYKNRTTIWPSNLTSGYKFKKIKKIAIWNDTWTLMFIAALSAISRIWKQPKCPKTDEWIKKMWHVATDGDRD